MGRPDLEALVTKILVDRLGIPATDITPEARLVDDLGMDSLDAVELAIATERQFDIGIAEEQVAQLKTVGDILALVQRLLDAKTASA